MTWRKCSHLRHRDTSHVTRSSVTLLTSRRDISLLSADHRRCTHSRETDRGKTTAPIKQRQWPLTALSPPRISPACTRNPQRLALLQIYVATNLSPVTFSAGSGQERGNGADFRSRQRRSPVWFLFRALHSGPSCSRRVESSPPEKNASPRCLKTSPSRRVLPRCVKPLTGHSATHQTTHHCITDGNRHYVRQSVSRYQRRAAVPKLVRNSALRKHSSALIRQHENTSPFVSSTLTSSDIGHEHDATGLLDQ